MMILPQPQQYPALRRDYGLHNRLAMHAVGPIVKKFEEIGVVTNIERPVPHRFARSAENIAILSGICRFLVVLRIRTALRHITAYVAFRSTSISVQSPAQLKPTD